MNLRATRESILGRHMSSHLRECVSRRNFLTSAAAAAGLTFWLPDLGQVGGQGQGKSAAPKPIPGGVSPLGIFIHHFPAQLTAAPLCVTVAVLARASVLVVVLGAGAAAAPVVTP